MDYLIKGQNMWQTLRQWLTFPTFADDPEKNYRAKLLYAITLMLIMLVGSNLVFLLATFYLLADVLLSLGLLVVLGWCLYWTQQGYVQRVSVILCFVLWLAVTTMVHFYGPRDVIASGYILIIIIATLLLGGVGGLGAIIMSALALSTIVLAEMNGLRPSVPLASLSSVLRIHIQIFLAVGLVMYGASRVISRALGQAQQNEKAYRASEEKLAHILAAAPISMALATPKGRFFQVNRAMCQMLGYSAAELEGMSFTEITHESDLVVSHQVIQKLIAGEMEQARYEKQYRHKNGQLIWAITNIYLVRDGRGDPDYFIGQIQDITERKAAEEALREHQEQLQLEVEERKRVEDSLRRSEKFLATTNQLARVGGWELDLQTDTLYWTDVIKEIHEVPLDYIPVLEEGIQFYAPEHVPIIQTAVEGAIAGKPYDLELQIITAKQKRLWVRALGVPVYEEGQVVRLQGVFHDIHEQKLAEDALRQSEANLREAQQIAKLGDFEFNLHTQEVRWSDEVYRIFGLEMGEIVDLERYQNLLAPEDFQRVMTAVTETIDSKQPYAIEHDIILSDGQRKHLYAIGRPLLNNEGQVNRIFGIVQDITEAKQAAQSMHESMVRYQALFEHANDAIFVYDLNGKVTTANSQACQLSGYALSEMIGQTPDLFVQLEDINEADQKFQLTRQGVVPPMYERTIVRKNGERRICEIRARRIEDENGEPLFIQGVVRDVSERKRTELQIQASLHEKEILLKEIHHRVKNNLQVISSLLDLQSTYVESADVYSMFQDSRARVRSMALVHEQLYQSADLARIDFVDYVHDLVGYLGRVYGNMVRVMIEVDIYSAALSVETAVPLGLIINEMVSNAYKHAFVDGRSGQIHIGLQKMKNNQFCLSVQDNGIGFPADIDFRRSPSLGLTIIMTLVDQLQGEIELDIQDGTRFELTFLSEAG